MSYMRGDIYIWAGDTSVHFWVRDGYDGWDDAGWHDPAQATGASGVALSQVAADEYVVMRMAEMLDEGCIVAAIERALEKYRGNGGCRALADHAETLRKVAAKVAPQSEAIQ